MTRVRPVWISSRVPAKVNCMQCHEPDAAAFAGETAQECYAYACEKCGFEVRLSLADLNDPSLRENLSMHLAKAS